MNHRNLFLTFVFIFAFVFISVGCKGRMGKGKVDAEKSGIEGKGEVYLSEPVEVENLIIYPLKRKNESAKGEYITLEQGLKDKKVIVKEIGGSDSGNTRNIQPNQTRNNLRNNLPPNEDLNPDNDSPPNDESNPDNNPQQLLNELNDVSGSVNAVEITNNSDKNLFILAGEVIIGGKQDRVVTCDLLIKPNEKKKVEVCCVEQGRWSAGITSFGYYELNFSNVTRNNISIGIRKEIQSKGQAAQSVVWNKVARHNISIGNDNTSDTYVKFIKHNEEKMNKLNKILADKLVKQESVCGFIACINGEIVGLELFANSKIYKLFEERMLKSYVLDAISENIKNKYEVSISSTKEKLELLKKEYSLKLIDAKPENPELKRLAKIIKKLEEQLKEYQNKINENTPVKKITAKLVQEYLVEFSTEQKKALKKGKTNFENDKITGFHSDKMSEEAEALPIHANSYKNK